MTEFIALFLLGWFAALSALPYLLSIARTTARRAVSDRIRISAFVAQHTVLLSLSTSLGIVSAHSVGLGAPLLERGLRGHSVSDQEWMILGVSLCLGLALAAVLWVTDAIFFAPRLPPRASVIASTTRGWRPLLASFYGGVTEEIYMRLFLFSVFTWAVSAFFPPISKFPKTRFWAVNVVVACLFAVGHLPLVRVAIGLTSATVTRTLFLNGLSGLLFGWLYWRYGIESSMIAHLSANAGIHLYDIAAGGAGFRFTDVRHN